MDDGGQPIQSYDVERKDVKTGKWVKVNISPVKECKFLDDRVIDGHTYEYRITAANKAGPGEPSDPSAKMTAKPEKG